MVRTFFEFLLVKLSEVGMTSDYFGLLLSKLVLSSTDFGQFAVFKSVKCPKFGDRGCMMQNLRSKKDDLDYQSDHLFHYPYLTIGSQPGLP